MTDQFERKIDYMRVSITDRCNLRCRYCMPEGIDLVQMKDVLTYEEIVAVCAAASQLGIKKLKVTGGEPLVRLGCADLIAKLKGIPGIEQVTMTTNGVLLGKYLNELIEAGLDAVNISLNTLNRERYIAITGRDELAAAMKSVEEAQKTPLRVKVNTVLQRGVNEDEWFSLASLARDRTVDVRFIEMMPIGFGKNIEGISNNELLKKLMEKFPGLEDDGTAHGNGPAEYVRIPGWKGSIGFISAIHGKFCDRCNRVRLTAQGRLKPCLCYVETTDLMPILRSEKTGEAWSEELLMAVEKGIYAKPKQHCFEIMENITENARMASIGG